MFENKIKANIFLLGALVAASFLISSSANAATCTCDNGVVSFATNITGGTNTWQECNKSCIANGHQRYNFNNGGYQNITSSDVTPQQLCINSGGTGLNAGGRCTGCEIKGKVTGAGAGSVCQTAEERDASYSSVSPSYDAHAYDNVTGATTSTQVVTGQSMNRTVPGTTTEQSQLVTCGRPGQQMCTLCDLIAGLNNIIRFIEHIAIGVGAFAFTIGGVMYVISSGDPGMKKKANDTMWNAVKGFVIIFAAWAIVNTVIMLLGTKTNLGLNITGWGNFECSAGQH